MGTKYSSISVSGYNSSPPSDDGSTAASNQVYWSTIKGKLSDPLNTFAAAVNSALVTALDQSVRVISSSDSSVANDHNRTVQIASTVTAAVTFSLMDAATAAAGYIVTVTNQSAIAQTIGRATASNTINGATSDYSLPSLHSVTFIVSSPATGYNIVRQSAASALATITGTEELTNKTLNASVGKGTWTASGTWTLPAVTLGGAVTLNAAVTGNSSADITINTNKFTVAAASGNTAVAGTLGVTGEIGGTSQRLSAGTSSTTLASNYALRLTGGATAANYSGIFFDGSTTYDSFFGRVPTALSGINDGVGYVTYAGGTPTLRTLFSSTGLAVTGTGTFTGVINTGSYARIGETLNGSITSGSAQTIYTHPSGGLGSALVLVTGVDGSGNWFSDLVLFNCNNSANTISSTVGGAPGTRTYTVSSSSLKLNPSVTQTRVRVVESAVNQANA